MLLRDLLAGSRSGVEDRSSAHRSLYAMMRLKRLKRFSVLRKTAAIQRKTLLPLCQGVTLRVRMRTPARGVSMMLVVARQRCSAGGMLSRLTVKRSSRPSSRLAAACGYFCSSNAASFLMRAMSLSVSSFQAARSTLLTPGLSSLGS